MFYKCQLDLKISSVFLTASYFQVGMEAQFPTSPSLPPKVYRVSLLLLGICWHMCVDRVASTNTREENVGNGESPDSHLGLPWHYLRKVDVRLFISR